jgi:hypothetical protein
LADGISGFVGTASIGGTSGTASIGGTSFTGQFCRRCDALNAARSRVPHNVVNIGANKFPRA